MIAFWIARILLAIFAYRKGKMIGREWEFFFLALVLGIVLGSIVMCFIKPVPPKEETLGEDFSEYDSHNHIDL